ncbi:MAG TPA: hypothetical protein VNW92_18710, partial [Polyangiaceae bacterium]|nr:hypothetical protein [Polyangiaceae bacterium]
NTCMPSPLPGSCSIALSGSDSGGTGGTAFQSVTAGTATGGAASASTGGTVGTGLASGNGGTAPVVATGGNGSTVGGAEAGDGSVGGAAGASSESPHWAPIAASPLAARAYHNAVWAGNDQGVGKLMIWGGYQDGVGTIQELRDGALYDPRTDSWSGVSQQGAPVAHPRAAAVWTGERVLVWGGSNAASSDPWAAYDPTANVWEPLPVCPFDDPYTDLPFATWTGKDLLILSEGFGIRYDVAKGQWARMASTGAPFASGGSAIWTGSQWIVWGGMAANGPEGSGAAYDPATDQWTPLPVAGAPTPRQNYVAAWTGKYMVIWGGVPVTDAPIYADLLFAYDPVAQTWTQHVVDAPPESAYGFPVVTTSRAVLVWDGYGASGLPAPVGHALEWQSWTWSALSAENQPAPRFHHSATWTGREMIIWGGTSDADLADGGRFTP